MSQNGTRILLVVLFAGLLLTPALTQPLKKRWTPASALQARTIGEIAIAPNGRQIAYIVKQPLLANGLSEYSSQIWLASARSRKSRQLTFRERACTQPAFSPDGRYLAYFTDDRNVGKTEIWLLSLQGGEPQQLTQTDHGVLAYAWSPKGKQIAYTTLDPLTEPDKNKLFEKRDAFALVGDNRNAHLYTIVVEPDRNGNHKLQRLTAGFFHISAAAQTRTPFSWSSNSKNIVFEHRKSPLLSDWKNSDISLVSVENNTVTPVITWAGADGQPVYSPNGKWLAFASEGSNSNTGIVTDIFVMPAKGGRAKKLAVNQAMPAVVNWSDNSSFIFYEAQENTANRLFRLPKNGTPATAYTMGNGTFSNFALNGKTAAFVYQSSDNAPELYFTSLRKNAPVQLTNFDADYPDVRMGKTETIFWYMQDSTRIEALLTYPVYREFDKLYPTVIILPDNPNGAFTNTFTARADVFPVQAFSQKGYAVLRVNLSQTKINATARINQHTKEIIAGVNKIIGMGVAHPDSLAIAGWGYGGYLTALTLTKSNRFSAACIGGAMTSLKATFSSPDNLHQPVEFLEMDAAYNQGQYADLSPILHADKIDTPTLILHGENDKRIPLTHALDFFHELKKYEVPTELIIFPRTGSHIAEPRLTVNAGERILNWLDKHIRQKKLLSQITIK